MRSLWASRTRLFRGGGVGLRCVLAGTTGNTLAFGGPFILGFLLATSHSLLLGHASVVGFFCATSNSIALKLLQLGRRRRLLALTLGFLCRLGIFDPAGNTLLLG